MYQRNKHDNCKWFNCLAQLRRDCVQCRVHEVCRYDALEKLFEYIEIFSRIYYKIYYLSLKIL